MQAKSESQLEFSGRTDRLAAALGLTVSELTKVLTLSNGMLFAYRSGKNPISDKAWEKLESAEIKAGLKKPPDDANPRPGSWGVIERKAYAQRLRDQAIALDRLADEIDPPADEEAIERAALAAIRSRTAELKRA